MIHLCLDTCTWIYLANGFEPGKLINYIEAEIQRGNIRVILPDLVYEEWKRNSTNAIINEVERNFKDSLNGITKIKQLIENQQNSDDFH